MIKPKSESKTQLFDAFRVRFLQHFDFDESFLSLSKLFSLNQYSRKSVFLRAGERWDKIYYIHQGLIRLFYNDIEGREFNKAFFWEGHCIWPVAPRDRSEDVLFSIAALEDVLALECPFQPFYQWLNTKGQWERFALPFAETLVEQKFLREHDLLLLSATERLNQFSNKNPRIISRIPDYHLASYLGITNVSLSRIKKSLNV